MRSLALSIILALAQATPQAQLQQPKMGPISPILKALDLNGNGILEANEIAAAPQSLLKLDANGDGRLTPDEYRPPRPDGTAQTLPPPRPKGEKAEAPKLERPRPLLDTTLDADGDEIISASEIAQAATLLRKLDRNGDGRLTRDEYELPPPGQNVKP